MTNPGRVKDLADVLELIKAFRIPANFIEDLNPFVRAKFAELQEIAADYRDQIE